MNLLDLFTGSGIGSLAATAAGINVVAQCENDPCCLYCLERLWPHAKQYTDVSTLTADALRRDGIGPIDIISGGFPCTDISTAGKGAGLEGERSGLWFEMRRIIDEVRPAWVLAENVPALRVRGGDRVLNDLEELGYAVWPIVVGAEHVGAPHKRHRVWIVAHRPRHGQSGQRETERADGMRTGEGGNEAMADARSQHTQCDTESWVTRCGESESSSGRGQAMADAQGDRQREPNDEASPEPRQVARQGVGGRSCEGGMQRWPAGRGGRQHDWELPRLVSLQGVHPGIRRFLRKGHPSLVDESRKAESRQERLEALAAARFDELMGGMGSAVDGLEFELLSETNKSLLRMAGNGWVYPIPEMIFRWIVEQERK